MMIDTGLPERPQAISAGFEDFGIGRLDFNRAERTHRQILANVWACENLDDLEVYEAEEAPMLDALSAHPSLLAPVTDAIEMQRACLAHPHPTVSGNPTKATMMNQFASFDTGGSGDQGPWLVWAAQERGFKLRSGSDKTPFDGFDKGVVLDVAGMKTGWQHSEGIAGVAPRWQWNPTLTKFEPRPGEEWKQGFQIKCAIGGGQTAVWEQAGASAWNGFLGLLPGLAQMPTGDVLPLVKLSGTREEKFNKGKATIPMLEIVKWVPRPDCLKAEAFSVATAPAAAAPKQAAPKEAEKMAEYLDDDVPF